MEQRKSLDLTQGTIWKVLLAFILPILAGSLIQQLYTTVDAVVVGRFAGKEGLAAIDSVYTMFKFPLNCLSGLSAGATIVISRLFGSRDDSELACAVRTAFTIGLILGVLFSLAGFLAAPALLRIMSVPEEIRASTLLYVRIYFAGLWTMTMYNMLAGILRAFGNSRSPLYILIVCCVINVAGDLILVGLLHTGVAGAAAATVAAQLISVILAMRALARTCPDKGPLFRVTFCRRHLSRMLIIGLPLALQSVLFPVANSIVQASINNMGTDAIAAWAVCGKLDMLIWLVADSMSPALSTYSSQNLGAQRADRILRGTAIGTALSVGTVALISLVLFLFPAPLGNLFLAQGDRAALTPMIVRYMRLMAPFYIFYALHEATSGSCCGMGDTMRPMILTLTCTCALRVIGIFLVLPRFGTMECIVWIYIASWIAAGLSFLCMFIHRIRRLESGVPPQDSAG